MLDNYQRMSLTTLDPVLTTEAARLCGVAPETIRHWHAIGRLPAVRTAGGVRLFSRADCERIAREREQRRLAASAALGGDAA